MTQTLTEIRGYQPFDYETQIINEVVAGVAKEKMILRGILQKADTLNHNGRIYPQHILEREVNNYQKYINENRSLGECDHPDSSTISLQKVSHIIREMKMEGKIVRGAIEVLPTPCGEIVKSLVKSGVKLGISSRGVGSLKQDGDVYIVQDDYQLLTLDVVSEPSTPGAFLLPESRNVNINMLKEFLTRSDRLYRTANEILSLH